MERHRRRAIVLGLDGATFDVLLPRVEQGQMSSLAALLRDGVWGPLQSTTPPFSAQAWVSMATGKNQARHGVVDFWQRSPSLDPGERRQFVTAQQVQGETLWHIAGRHGLRVGVVNVPITYPPPQVNGYVVSGLLTPQGRDDFVYPAVLRDEVLAQVPGYNPDPFDPMGVAKRQILELENWMHKHEVVSRFLMDRHPVDLFFGVVQALDHLQHRFWEDIANRDSTGERATLIDRVYRFADEIIGHRAAALDGRTNLFLVSDHGFGPAHKWFHVNRFLVERGLLTFGEVGGGSASTPLVRLGLTPQNLRAAIRRLDVLGLRRWMGRLTRSTLGRRIDQALAPAIDWSRTFALSGSPATEGIFVNLKGREREGIVEPGKEYETLRERLMVELRALRDPETNEPVIQEVYRREELYQGPFLEMLPDVVFDLGDRPYLASDTLTARQIVEPLPPDAVQGRHRPTGIFVATGPDILAGQRIEGARIIDVAPTLLYGLGLPIPEDMDGRPLVEIFDEGFRAAHPVRYSPPEAAKEIISGSDYDPEDAAEMERRLRGLGYVS